MHFKHSYKYFNPSDFENTLALDNWYIKLLPQINKYILSYHKNKENPELFTEEFLHERKEFIQIIGEYLAANKIKMSTDTHEGFFDKERKEIDTIVIHHKGRNKDADLEYIESVEMLNLFVRDFIIPGTEYFKRPLFSGHLRNGRQCFLAYHYVVYPDGKIEQILKDEYIGWHCGNKGYNNRSIAINIMDTLIDKQPTAETIDAIKKIIAKYNPKEILGHGEIKENESCPGNLFLGEKGWKRELIQ